MSIPTEASMFYDLPVGSQISRVGDSNSRRQFEVGYPLPIKVTRHVPPFTHGGVADSLNCQVLDRVELSFSYPISITEHELNVHPNVVRDLNPQTFTFNSDVSTISPTTLKLHLLCLISDLLLIATIVCNSYKECITFS